MVIDPELFVILPDMMSRSSRWILNQDRDNRPGPTGLKVHIVGFPVFPDDHSVSRRIPIPECGPSIIGMLYSHHRICITHHRIMALLNLRTPNVPEPAHPHH